MKLWNDTALLPKSMVRTMSALALAAICMLGVPAALYAQRVAVDRVTVTITADAGVIEQVVEAAKGAGIPRSPGGALMIPVDIVKTLALNALIENIGTWLKNCQLCDVFDKWAVGKKVGDVGTITIEFVLVAPGEKPTPSSPRVVVPMFVKKTGDGGATARKGGGVRLHGADAAERRGSHDEARSLRRRQVYYRADGLPAAAAIELPACEVHMPSNTIRPDIIRAGDELRPGLPNPPLNHRPAVVSCKR